VHAATLVRIAANFAPAALFVPLLGASGVLWSVAFLTYFVVYLPRLARPRLDGKPG
jgi:uncharacterized protein involved in response to NO